MSTTMRAVMADDYGPPERLTVGELPIPRPGPGQIQVRVRTAALNPFDLRLLGGALREMAPLSFPHVVGGDFAGTVSEIGAGVTRFRPGDEVFGLGLPRTVAGLAAQISAPPSLTTGALAEYAVLDADTPGLALRPSGLAADHAATLPTVGLTAVALVRAGQFRAGETVLVVGATGGVGGAVLPLLATAGVRVIATSGPDDESYVRGLGAADTVDHRAGDLVGAIARRHPSRLDGVVNLVLAGPELVALGPLIRPGGRLLTIVYPAPEPASFAGADVRVETVVTTARPGELEEVAAWALDGALPATISGRYRLADGARASVDLAPEHTRGKLVVVADAET
jgi:NADPH:quinone reductase-like Zn-dependent oxidoreductase